MTACIVLLAVLTLWVVVVLWWFCGALQYVVRDGAGADALVHLVTPRARRFQDDAQDFFIVRRGTFPWSTIPEFVVGRPAYDNWLLDYAEHHDFDTVDLSKTVHAIHQTGVDGNKAGHVVRFFCHEALVFEHWEVCMHCLFGVGGQVGGGGGVGVGREVRRSSEEASDGVGLLSKAPDVLVPCMVPLSFRGLFVCACAPG